MIGIGFFAPVTASFNNEVTLNEARVATEADVKNFFLFMLNKGL